MTKNKIAILVITIVVMASSAIAEGVPGDSGFLSLRLPVGARETAMGGAGVASSNGAAAVFWNPALSAFEDNGTDLLLQGQRWMGFFDKETLTVSHRNCHGSFGFLFSGLYSDDIPRYEGAAGIPSGTFNPYQVAFGVSYGRKINNVLSAGMMVKFLHEEIDLYGGNGFAFDFSLAHKTKIDGLWFGASVTNIGPDITINVEPYQLPTMIRFGFSYEAKIGLNIVGDVVIPNDGNTKAHTGIEYTIFEVLALRAGTKVNYESQGFTAGAGFNKGMMTVGYAFEDMINDLDPSHRFALEISY